MEQEQIKNEITFEDLSSDHLVDQHHLLEPSLNTDERERELEDNISGCEIQIFIINDEINERCFLRSAPKTIYL